MIFSSPLRSLRSLEGHAMWTHSLPISHACRVFQIHGVRSRTEKSLFCKLFITDALLLQRFACSAAHRLNHIYFSYILKVLEPLKSVIMIALFKPSVRDFDLMDLFRYMRSHPDSKVVDLKIYSLGNWLRPFYIRFLWRKFAFSHLENGWFSGFIKM